MTDDAKALKVSRWLRRKDIVSRWLEYAYFLRFPILFYGFLPVLCALDWTTGVAILSRGIMTVESGLQAFFAAFFIVAYQMTALVTARNIARNGNERFAADPPTWLMRVMSETKAATMWWVLGAAQFPGMLALAYLGYTAMKEGEKLSLTDRDGSGNIGMVWLFFALGVAAAWCFWHLVSLLYYWIYRNSAHDAAALIFPKSRLQGRLQASQPPPRFDRVIEWWYRILKLTLHGYAKETSGPFYELHILSAIGFAGYLLLYLFLYPLTAPVARHNALHFGTVAALLISGIFLWLMADGPRTEPPESKTAEEATGKAPVETAAKIESADEGDVAPRRVKWMFRTIAVVPVAIFAVNLASAANDRTYESNFLSMAFPALASILVILTFSLWMFTALSFFFDRYRVPVLTVFVLFVALPNFFIHDDHYYAAKVNKKAALILSPAEILSRRMPMDASETQSPPPAIIVTAAGGGIHAAAWTARLLAELEERFDRNRDLQETYKPKGGYTFHQHLLLASGVSGGSSGLVPYLLEYTGDADQSFNAGNMGDEPGWNAFRTRVSNPPACSGLEAVAWGLEYYDLYRLVLGWFPVPTHFAEGEAPDRSWALAEAFKRNLTDRHCNPETLKGSKGGGFTLGDAASMLSSDAASMPAFTFNTTAAETGGRFLLANYYVPDLPDVPDLPNAHADFLPAESFLHTYGGVGCPKAAEPADITLPIAARLSATFPYVTSGTRLPTCYNTKAFHFLDGGYFDNDGTGSVIEFLHSALGANGAPPCRDCKPEAKPPLKRNILLVEIRDSEDVASPSQESLPAQNANGWKWKLLDQIKGPPVGLYDAGHESVSRRNRRELCLLEKAYGDQLNIYHVVFTIHATPGEPQPLNWNLTALERDSIDEWVSPSGAKSAETKDETTSKTIKLAIDWVNKPTDKPDETCRANVAP